ncbi:hypothetical protein TRFO_07217 [Tritrichomonas foetus]|uniref:Uncharacterized protein n=1 Tax=Tritrichomonas foetus TaxID=1144522 RepID=A0A1J4JXW6_9EUKA|nr:hypothetical protein TRFO_07217 [Tritrichomonas foetus]|eukprot:OHT02358.1 hypothetical protein TRFO_07217 [Tritrichomonas foetus]
MPILFPYEYSHILRHSSDETTLDIQISPANRFWLSLSPSSISLFSSKDNKFLAKYPLTNEQISKFGFFTHLTWINDNQFAVLFSFGFIFLFSLADSFLKLENIFDSDSDSNSTRLSITSFNHDFIVCGDDLGRLSFFPAFETKEDNIVIKISDFPIKKIQFNNNLGIILSADGGTFSFPIDISDIRKKDHHFILKSLSQTSANSLSLSKKNIVAIFETNNNILLTEICTNSSEEETYVRFKARSASRALVTFADDLTLFVLYNNGFVTVYNFVLRVSHSFKFPELISCNCISATSQNMIVSNETGIFVFPLFSLSYSEFPLLYGPATVVEFRPVKKGAIPVQYHLPIDETINCVCADENEMYLAISLESNIMLIDRSNSSFISNDKLIMASKFIQFSGNILCVVEFQSFHYFLKFIAIQNNFETLSTFDLPNSPIGLTADSTGCVVMFNDHLSVFDNFKFLQNIELESIPIHCVICNGKNVKKIIVLLQNRKLLLIEYGEVIKNHKILDDCSEFFYDPNFSLIFVIKGIHIKFCSLTNLKLIPFCECADNAIGVISSCSAILFLSSNKFEPLINYFFDFSIVSEMQNPNAAAQTILPMRKATFFPNLLRQISVFALREKMGRNLVIFLSHFPELQKFCLASALRAVESPERKGVFESLGTASQIFAMFAGLSIDSHRSGIVVFNERTEVPESDIKHAAILLPVVMEEEGPNIAFPATFYILKKLHYDIEYIESLFRFLDPLVSPFELLEDGKISAIGMIMEIKEFSELKRRLSDTVDFCMIDLLVKYMPHLIIPFAYSAQVPLNSFFEKHKSMDLKANIINVMDRVAPLLTENKATKQELKTFGEESLRGGWEVWPIAMFILAGDTVKATRMLSTKPHLMKPLSQSQWIHLL